MTVRAERPTKSAHVKLICATTPAATSKGRQHGRKGETRRQKGDVTGVEFAGKKWSDWSCILLIVSHIGRAPEDEQGVYNYLTLEREDSRSVNGKFQ